MFYRIVLQAAWLLRAVTCIDLTTLSGDDTLANVNRLCFKAKNAVMPDLLKAMDVQDLGNVIIGHQHMSHIMRKPTFCICENKDADQLRGNREADQRLCFPYIDSTIPLLSKCEISSF